MVRQHELLRQNSRRPVGRGHRQLKEFRILTGGEIPSEDAVVLPVREQHKRHIIALRQSVQPGL